MKTQQKQFVRFVPTLALNVLNTLEYKRKDDLYVIIDLIYRKNFKLKTELQKQYGWTDISRATFQNLIAKPANILSAINFLVENEIIHQNNSYSVGAFSKSYKINPDLLSRKAEVIIQDKNINKKIELIEKEKAKMADKRLAFSQTNYFRNFKIDHEKALAYIDNKAFNEIKALLESKSFIKINDEQIRNIIDCKGQYKKHRGLLLIGKNKELHHILHRLVNSQFKILAIKNGYLYFNRNTTNNRLDSNLTSLPTELRQFLISDEKLFNVDIKNSQPFFLYALLKKESNISQEELERYGQIVISGKFYEYLATSYDEAFKAIKTRKDMKDLLFKIFFSKPSSFRSIKTFFGSLFPNIMNHIDKTNMIDNATLANQLSSIESDTIITKILPILNENFGIKAFTIHDSFVCRESEVEAIVNSFNLVVNAEFGIAPSLHVLTLIDEANKNDEIEVESINELDAISLQYLEELCLEEFLMESDRIINEHENKLAS